MKIKEKELAAAELRAKRRLLGAAVKTAETVLIQYDTTLAGYDAEKVEEMRDEYGANRITQQKKTPLIKKFLGAFVNPFTIVLFVLAGISLITDVLIAPAGERDVTAVVIVMAMVFVSGALRFAQELRSNNAAQRLGELVETTVAVMRQEDGAETEKREIPLDEVVVGDVVRLAAGDIIPADVRIVQAKDLFVSQASLTGESEPVEKFAAALEAKPRSPLEANNLAFMGSTVVSGSAVALVLATGDHTIFGSIARELQVKAPPTSFEKGVSSVSWVLIRFMLVMAPVVLFINGFTKGD